ASRATRPGRRRLALRAHDPERGLRSRAVELDVRIVPGYELLRAEAGRLLVRNRTDGSWRSDQVWLAPIGVLEPRVAMDEDVVGPGETAAFTLPPALASVPLDLVHHRTARYLPSPLSPAPRARGRRVAGRPRRARHRRRRS
ncbi:MAG: hypothetical protein JWM93_3236, partial [Frankiales bacterium]|nr:hypothetical protein [Frankiales bacterium]